MNIPNPVDPDNADVAMPTAEPIKMADRGVSPIGSRLGGSRQRWITLGALSVGCFALLAATWEDDETRPNAAQPGAEGPARQVVPFEPAARAASPFDDANGYEGDAPVLSSDDPDQIPALAGSAPEPTGYRNAPSSADERAAVLESARRAPLMAWQRSGGATTTGATERVSAGPNPMAQGPGTPLDGLRQASPIGRAHAGSVGDRSLLMTAGAAVPCLLQTAMDSTTPGYVVCQVPNDVYSDNGAVVVMERGTRVLGEYQGGLQQGRSHLFVLWTRAVTPQGVTITLASPAADALGRAGFDGRVDTHFWERFGGALLLSIVDDGLSAIDQGGGEGGYARASSDAASTALQSSVGIPATLRKDQGSEVSIFVAQDLDFSSVYRLRPR